LGAAVQPETVWTAVASLLVSALLTPVVRRLALASGMVDIPTARSSHQVSTPRGGGVVIVVVTSAVCVFLRLRRSLDAELFFAGTLGGLAVALVGLLDDRKALSSAIRLLVHFAAAAWAVCWLGGLPALRFGDYLLHPGWVGDTVAVLGIVWALNLFNFMDGIDGLAGSEAVFVLLAGAALTATAATGLASLSLTLAAASCGFLLWNWPPAKIFLGDAGSGYLGYMIAVVALAAGRSNPVALWVWLILGGAFFVDATMTLLRRVSRGDHPSQPHRSHAYQWLARRWHSHRKVTLLVLSLDLLWLLPWALFAARRPQAAAAAVVGALAPAALLALAAGSGRREPARS
jgi:Fuc2NAc and GlcNAc transferase